MPYKIVEKNGQQCVVKESDGTEMGCHATRKEALAQLAALKVNEGFTLEGIDAELAESLRAEFKGQSTYELDVEVFAPGKWNGYPFTVKDLESIVANFDHFAQIHQVPLKLGHDDNQPLTDGMPSLGRVTRLWVADGKDGKPKLMAHFAELPKIVYDAIKAKRYNKVSIELDLDVQHGGKVYDFVMSGVALLGSALPAVNTLADLSAYMTADSLVCGRRLAFSLATDENGLINNVEGTKMPITEEEERQLRERLRLAEENEAKFKREAQEASDAKARFEREQKERDEREKAERIEAHRKDIKGLFEKAVTDMRVTPAVRDRLFKVARVDDDEAVMAFSREDAEALIKDFSVDQTGARGSGARGSGEGKQAHEDTGEALDLAVRKIQAESGGRITYTRGLELAMRADPDLAREHINASGTIGDWE